MDRYRIIYQKTKYGLPQTVIHTSGKKNMEKEVEGLPKDGIITISKRKNKNYYRI